MTTEWFAFWNKNEEEANKLDLLFATDKSVAQSVLYQLNARNEHIVVEFGCGKCNLLSLIDKSTCALGIDFSEMRVKGYDKNRLLVNDSFNTNLKDESIDQAFCFSLFNFLTIEETIATIEEMLRVTKKGGFILLGDILKEECEGIFSLRLREQEVKCPGINFYSKRTLSKIVENMIGDDSGLLCYDTKIGDYCNNDLSFNLLIWKR